MTCKTVAQQRLPRVSLQWWPEEEVVVAVGVGKETRLSQDQGPQHALHPQKWAVRLHQRYLLEPQHVCHPPSVPALTGTAEANNDLASLFECPVCFDYVLPPILPCQNGHLVCLNCRPKLTHLACQGPLGSTCNLAMEKVTNSVLFPCTYSSSGCELTLWTNSTQKRQTMKSSVSLGLVPVCSLVLPTNGKALWMLLCHIWWITMSPWQTYRERK